MSIHDDLKLVYPGGVPGDLRAYLFEGRWSAGQRRERDALAHRRAAADDERSRCWALRADRAQELPEVEREAANIRQIVGARQRGGAAAIPVLAGRMVQLAAAERLEADLRATLADLDKAAAEQERLSWAISHIEALAAVRDNGIPTPQLAESLGVSIEDLLTAEDYRRIAEAQRQAEAAQRQAASEEAEREAARIERERKRQAEEEERARILAEVPSWGVARWIAETFGANPYPYLADCLMRGARGKALEETERMLRTRCHRNHPATAVQRECYRLLWERFEDVLRNPLPAPAIPTAPQSTPYTGAPGGY